MQLQLRTDKRPRSSKHSLVCRSIPIRQIGQAAAAIRKHSLLASPFWRQIFPETETVAARTPHPRVPEKEMMAPLVPFETGNRKEGALAHVFQNGARIQS